MEELFVRPQVPPHVVEQINKAMAQTDHKNTRVTFDDRQLPLGYGTVFTFSNSEAVKIRAAMDWYEQQLASKGYRAGLA
ncbi:hypothetical protein [Deinococcus peraridilitoris]|uniref:Uncharacterized protein n=1 Tax=Deinococcus peraridilitoris (strain DSM 19664 / LMG 22246 / CIP 109416 / KR-200) TaxID=937777 RepID=L0A260_DEIPD|nr:hypothetical protein [Deinococcus peraridilitoris]AFZ67085.1 hypothetical protein Deipe_1544 [Deinococcus peraridilitoris DSM 19664]